MSDDPATEPEPGGDEDFDPGAHIGDISGRAYLEVKWRVVWLRRECPDADIITELIERTPDFALFRAVVTRPGNGSATGWGSETKADFNDFIEKAETKALGRALAALGYGTAAAGDFEDGAASGRPVDAPVGRPAPRGGFDGATEKQVKAIYAFGRSLHWSDAETSRAAGDRYQSSPEGLSKRQASEFIDFLKAQGGEPTQSRMPALTPEQRDHETRQRGERGPYADRSIPGAMDALREAVADRNYGWREVREMCKRQFGTGDPTKLTTADQLDELRGVVMDTHHEVAVGGDRWTIVPGPAPVGAAT